MTMSEQPQHRLMRPSIHFTPATGWINDPNGLVYLDGEYHLFYQHHPDSTVWGPMHWGHAVSRDLIHWQHLPIALAPDAIGAIFSGSAVIDHANTAGFGTAAMIAVFTHHTPDRGQMQSLAYSLDKGRTWTKYANNPVLQHSTLAGAKDFRDPKVFWYTDGKQAHWVMALAVAREIHFYRSPNLRDWIESSHFGADFGSHSGVWECPEIFQINIEGADEKRWVLIVSVGSGAPAGGSGVQYFVGDFDGTTFVCQDAPERVRWVDYGADFYAVQAWNNTPGGQHVWLAWMSNWSYANKTPDADGWRGAMTLPRELTLHRDGVDVGLLQQPVQTNDDQTPWISQRIDHANVPIHGSLQSACTVGLSISIGPDTSATQFGLRMRGDADYVIQVSYRPHDQQLQVERSAAGPQVAGIAGPHVVALAPRDSTIKLRMIIDQTSIEIFADEGRIVLTEQCFLNPQVTAIELFADGGAVQMAHQIQVIT